MLLRFLAVLLLPLVMACSNKTETPPATGPLAVRVAQVGADNSGDAVETAGTVALREETALAFTSGGRIARILVNEGDPVRRGQLLATLDVTPVSSGLDAAIAEQNRARAELRRLEPLMDKGWITRPRYEAAVAAAQSADAAVRAQRFALDTARIVASGDGVVLARPAEPGQIVAQGMPVLVIGQAASGFVLRAPLSDREAVRLERGAPARVVLEALEGEALTGSVLELGSRADRATGTFQVEIALPPDPRLRSGLIGRASITASPPGDLAAPLLVPPLAIFGARAGEGFVFVLDAQNRVRLRKVRLGEAEDGGVKVLAGLKPGEWVAIAALDRLQDGMTVRPERRSQ
ncbi:MAG: efflux RND transporter periplasmic adaptor subunit [Rhodobacteraceae bacterium]|nr:efflux RND transporter periplasmic adaptor subunit [Paracoccaceae bacterium]